MTPEQVYSEWRSSLKTPDDSLFYYHPDLERILLGLSIYAISSHPLFKDLGKAESLRILNIYIGIFSKWRKIEVVKWAEDAIYAPIQTTDDKNCSLR